MRLRTQFLLGVAILLIIVLGMGGFALYTALHVEDLRGQQAVANALERQANDLSYISNNYLLYREASQVTQWDSTYSSFQANVARLRVDEPQEAALAAGIGANAKRVEAVFKQIVSAIQAGGGSGVVATPEYLQMSWSRLEVQNRQIVFDAARLDRLLGEHVDGATLRSNMVVFALVAVFGLLILAGYIFMYRRTLAGISALKAGAEIVGTGDLDHHIPDNNRDELGDLSRAFNKMTTDLKSMGGMYLSQLHIASKLQQSLLDLPEQTQGIEFGHLYRSATLEAAVGGDFYSIFQVSDSRVALLIGDVSGHGVEAARVATLVKDVVYAFCGRTPVPSAVVASTNELLIDRRIPGFVTLFLAILDLRTGLLTYCSAGHPNALVVGCGGHLEFLNAASSPVGIFPGKSWQDSEVTLTGQDLLFLYTDGVIEARRNGHFFGWDGLAQAIQSAADPSPGGLPTEVLDAVLAFADGVLADDAALLTVRWTGNTSAGAPAWVGTEEGQCG